MISTYKVIAVFIKKPHLCNRKGIQLRGEAFSESIIQSYVEQSIMARSFTHTMIDLHRKERKGSKFYSSRNDKRIML